MGRRRAATAEHGVFDFSSWDPQPAGSHPAGASAWGVEDLVGNGWEWTSTPFAPFPGFQRDGVVSRVLRGFLRRRTLRDEGRVAGDRSRAAAAELPQLVPRAAIRTSTRHSGASNDHANHRRRLRRAVCRRRAVLPDARAAPAAVALLLRRPRVGAVRRDLRAAVVRHHARRDAAARRARPGDPRALPGFTTIIELGPGSGAKLATLVEGGRRQRPSVSICGWSTSRRARSSSPRGRWPRSRTCTSSPTRRTYEVGLVQAAGDTTVRPRARAVSGIEHRQLRSSGRRSISARDSGQPAARRRAADGRRSREARARSAARVRRSAGRHRRVQPQPARPDQPRARRKLRRGPVRPPRGVGAGGLARGDAPGEPDRAARAHHGHGSGRA